MNRIIVDGHQDIAYNALTLHRDYLTSALETRKREGLPNPEDGSATVGLPEALAGNVRVTFATLFTKPCRARTSPGDLCYDTPEQAAAQAQAQVLYYANLAMDPRVSLITTRDDLERVVSASEPQAGLVLLMENGDPLLTPQHAQEWFDAGVRIIGPAWSSTRYCGGTRAPGPLTDLGRALVGEMERVGLILDLSHMADESFFQALDLFGGTVIAGHANCRAFVPTDRHLSDDMIRRLVARGGVIGILPHNSFLVEGWKERGSVKAEVTLADVVKHMRHVCELAGDAEHVAIGSDFDGGFGLEGIPAEMDTVADLGRIGEALAAAGFPDGDIDNILGGNWLRVLRQALPAGA